MRKQIDLITGDIKVDGEFNNRWLKAAKTVEKHNLWKDSFMKTLELPEQDPYMSWCLLTEWTKQMYHGSLAFPRYVGNLVARVKNHSAGRLLAINAAVERGYPDESRSHFLLAVELLRAIGLSDEEIISIKENENSRRYIEGHLGYTRDAPLAKAIGCLGLGIETLTTKEFTYLGNAYVKTASLTANMPPERVYQTQGYFTENIMADCQHSIEFEKIAFLTWSGRELPTDISECFAQISEGAKYSLDLRRSFFQEVYEKVKK